MRLERIKMRRENPAAGDGVKGISVIPPLG
jgi:hypothetical protein